LWLPVAAEKPEVQMEHLLVYVAEPEVAFQAKLGVLALLDLGFGDKAV
jgi:hypothetical protein